MNGFEMLCIIVGAIFLLSGGVSIKNWDNAKELWIVMFHNIIKELIAACLILLPLYFNYWRK
jgi:hypothetical protein